MPPAKEIMIRRSRAQTSIDGQILQEKRHTGRGSYEEEGPNSLLFTGGCGEKTAKDVKGFK